MSTSTTPSAPTMKVLLLGDSGVGKSSLMLRFAQDTFSETLATTIGIDFRVRPVDLGPQGTVNVQIWDTAGQERFRTLTSSYYRGAHGIIFVYDVTSPASFSNGVRHWMEEAAGYTAGREVAMLLVANKIDRCGGEGQEPEDEGTRREAEDFARRNKMLYLRCSAKTKEGVVHAFEEVARQVADKPSFQEQARAKQSLNLGDGSDGHAHGGCQC